MRILIACGGTAGHLFPGLALAEELKKENGACQILLVISDHPRDKEFLMRTARPILKELQLETTGTIALPYSFSFKYLFFSAKLFLAFLKSFLIILRYSPEVAVGFGGYTSFAPVVIARLIGVPTLIHEQNLVPGRANRLLARIVDRIAVSFNGTDRYFSLSKTNKIVETGLPLRKHIFDYNTDTLNTFRLEPNKFTILVLGGSQGAHNINELALDCFRQMNKTRINHLQVLHLSGKKDFQYVKEKYQSMDINSCVFGFLEDIGSAYRVCDLLIGRCGASTVFEAAHFGLPCIFIPYPHGTQNQKENAAYLRHLGAAFVLVEENATVRELQKYIFEIVDNAAVRENLSQKIGMLKAPEASRKLKEEVIALCKRK